MSTALIVTFAYAQRLSMMYTRNIRSFSHYSQGTMPGIKIRAAIVNAARTAIATAIVAVFFISTVWAQPELSSAYIPAQSAREFHEWLSRLPASQDRNHSAHRFLLGIQASLKIPSDGRIRFLMPRAKSASKKLKSLLDQSFHPEERTAYEDFIERVVKELRQSAAKYESISNDAVAYRLQWLAAGFQALHLGMDDAPWSPSEPLTQLRRVNPTVKGVHPITQWPASRYQLIQTPNFEIAFQNANKDAVEIAEVCEQIYAIWQQIFFSYCNEVETASRRAAQRQNPFQVVVFPNRNAYEKGLQSLVPSIGFSTGYYNQNTRASFFFFEKKSYATLVHELTHQFFVEATEGSILFDADKTAGFWVAEGIALFMESYSAIDLGGSCLVDIGGWDSNRLQAARFRFLRDQTWFPWEYFGAINGQKFKTLDDLAPRYSQACGLAHSWMEMDSKSRALLIRNLTALYRQGTPSPLQPSTDDELIQWYRSYMLKGPAQSIDYLPHDNRNELVLSRTKIDSAWLLEQLKLKRNWDSLDVAFTEVDDTAWTNPNVPWDIVRLNVESTHITDNSLESFAKMPRLTELDLSNCEITDSGLRSLAGNKTLRTLWLAGTGVTDQALEILLSMPRLEALQVRGSKITEDGWKRLIQKLPRLKANSTGP